jgi:hypothetical protein
VRNNVNNQSCEGQLVRNYCANDIIFGQYIHSCANISVHFHSTAMVALSGRQVSRLLAKSSSGECVCVRTCCSIFLLQALLEYLFGVRCHVSGDRVLYNEPAIIIMNHRTRLDWMFLWSALYKMDPWLLTTEKISLKKALKKVIGASALFYLYLIYILQVGQWNVTHLYFLIVRGKLTK